MNDDIRELELKCRAAFDESVDSIDPATRARLARARARALAGLGRWHAPGSALWIPAGAAAAALAAAILWKADDGGAPPGPELAQVTLEDLHMMTAEDFEMLQEEEGFYAWAAEQMSEGIG